MLPGDGRSGGVRVTVIMANLLLARGHTVRIACPRRGPSLRTVLSKTLARLQGRQAALGFLHEFQGQPVFHDDPNEIAFVPGEIVIAVGTYSVPTVRAITQPVVKLRFNHGFPAKPDALQEQAWRGSMPTITVSNTLVPELERRSGERVLAVVPNGIDTAVYFPEPAAVRTGIGAVLNHHPNKAPEDMLAVLVEAHRRWPNVPQHLFSTELRPSTLAHTQYTRLPTAAEARAIYNRCRIWLLTSRTEGLPGVVLEAMACGCVVISTDNDGSLEILRHDENGVIVPRGDRAAFLREIDRVLHDDELARRLAQNALATVQTFTWERAADKMEAVISSLSRSA